MTEADQCEEGTWIREILVAILQRAMDRLSRAKEAADAANPVKEDRAQLEPCTSARSAFAGGVFALQQDTLRAFPVDMFTVRALAIGLLPKTAERIRTSAPVTIPRD